MVKTANFKLFTPDGIVIFEEKVTENFEEVVENHRKKNPKSSVNYFIDRDNWGCLRPLQEIEDEKTMSEEEFFKKYYKSQLL